MNKKIVGFVIIVVFLLFMTAPFTFRDQIQGILSLFFNDSDDQINQPEQESDLNHSHQLIP